MSFANLHTHTDYSVLDSVMTVKQAFDTAKKLEYRALAITEHGNLASLFAAYNESIRSDVKYIPGIEFNFLNDEKDQHPYHLVVIASNHNGLKSIMRVAFKAYERNFKIPSITWSDLGDLDKDGVFVLSGCSEGLVARKTIFFGVSHGMAATDRFVLTFGDRFFMELNTPINHRQRDINDMLVEIANKKGVPLLVTTDSHYAVDGNKDLFPVILAIQCNSSVYANESVYDKHPLLSEGDVVRLMGDSGQRYVDMANEVADRCEDAREYLKPPQKFMMPAFDVSSMDDYHEFLEWKNKWRK